MPDIPRKKVGLVACGGEEMAEGTISRNGTRLVLEELRPGETVTICLPLFLAGGQEERAFARFFPTIAIDGCEKRCAFRATEKYSGKPVDGIVVTDFWQERGLPQPQGRRRLDEAGQQATRLLAEELAARVDRVLGRRETAEPIAPAEVTEEPVVEACACASGIPVMRLTVSGNEVTLIALPAIFEQLYQEGKAPSDGVGKELLQMAKIYNPIPAEAEDLYKAVILHEYARYCASGRDKCQLTSTTRT
jgi:uncharacterized metal-binding protein